MDKPPPLARTAGNSATISLEHLRAPGVQTHLIVEAKFLDGRLEDKDRIRDRQLREFEVKARLSRHPADPHDLNAEMQPDRGSSFFQIPQGISQLELSNPIGAMVLTPNRRGELAIASSTIKANDPHEARMSFEKIFNMCFDHFCYAHSAPAFIAILVVRDISNEVQYIYFQSPPRKSTVSDNMQMLYAEMQPVYAMYREALNSNSSYYRFLSFYKIMEGLLGPLRVSVQKRAKLAGIAILTPKALVPDHPDIPPTLCEHIGKPIKAFVDDFLTKRYRDEVAHFELKEKFALNVSSPEYTSGFAQAAFDLCVRALIKRHEISLDQLNQALP